MAAAVKGPWDADPDAPAKAPAKGPWDDDEDAPDARDAAVAGANDLLWFGFEDETEGALRAAGDFVTGKGFDYAKRRDEVRARQKLAQELHPDAYRSGQFGGAGFTLLVPGGGTKTLLGAVGKGAAMGAASGLGESEADLTKGEVGQAALDTGLGGLAGGAAGAVVHGAGKALDALQGRAAGGIRRAEADAAQAAWEKAQGALRVARSSVGGEVAAGLNAVQKAEEVVANAAGHYTPAQVAQAKTWLADPAVAALRQNAAQNVLDRGADRLVGSLQSARNVMQSAAANVTPQAVDAAAADALDQPLRRQILPRLANIGHRLLPAAAAGIGGLVGGPEGAIAGTGLGAVIALTSGRPGVVIRNLLRTPAVRRAAWQAVQGGVEALGKFGPALQRAAIHGGIELAHTLHEALLDSDPEYQAKVGALLEQQAQGQ